MHIKSANKDRIVTHVPWCSSETDEELEKYEDMKNDTQPRANDADHQLPEDNHHRCKLSPKKRLTGFKKSSEKRKRGGFDYFKKGSSDFDDNKESTSVGTSNAPQYRQVFIEIKKSPFQYAESFRPFFKKMSNSSIPQSDECFDQEMHDDLSADGDFKQPKIIRKYDGCGDSQDSRELRRWGSTYCKNNRQKNNHHDTQIRYRQRDDLIPRGSKYRKTPYNRTCGDYQSRRFPNRDEDRTPRCSKFGRHFDSRMDIDNSDFIEAVRDECMSCYSKNCKNKHQPCEDSDDDSDSDSHLPVRSGCTFFRDSDFEDEDEEEPEYFVAGSKHKYRRVYLEIIKL